MKEHESDHSVPLEDEPHTLRDLLRRYREDRRFLRKREGAKLVTFLDAHDVTAFINPDKPHVHEGFGFDAEEFADPAGVPFELKYRSDQLMRQFLFSDAQVGLLPSHGVELDEEVAFRLARQMNDKLKALAQAKREVVALRRSALGIAIIKQAASADESTRQSIMSFLAKNAPAFMTLLRPNPDTPGLRIQSLLHESSLVGLSEFAWEALGIARPLAQELRATRALPTKVEAWRDFLTAQGSRHRNSSRANRIDAEAIASVEALNDRLYTITEGRVAALLVTRAMTMLKATMRLDSERFPSLKVPEFLRHSRMVVLPGEMQNLAIDGAVARLSIALDTFCRQTGTTDGIRAPHEDPKHLFIEAWHGFESARLTHELHKEVRGTPQDPKIEETEFPTVMHWLARDKDFDQLIESETNRCIRAFDQATFKLRRDARAEPIEARITALSHPRRKSIRPLLAGVPGPVEFSAPELQAEDGICFDLEKLLESVSASPGEQYLAWAVLHSCRYRFPLAAIYARAAADVVTAVPGQGTRTTLQEAQLLYAQARRFGELDASPQTRQEIAHRRFRDVEDRFQRVAAYENPRILHEWAAQIIELALVCDESGERGAWLGEGIERLERAAERSRDSGDDITEGRCYAMLLVYVLAVLRRNLLWPANAGEMMPAAARWHAQLETLLQHASHPDEVPCRTRAMHIVGYLIIPGHANAAANHELPSTLRNRVSDGPEVREELRTLAPELYDQIKYGSDQVASLIAKELDRIVAPMLRYKQWDVVHAPIWAVDVTNDILTDINDSEIRELIRDGYELLKTVAGSDQHGVDAVHRRSYRHVIRLLRLAVEQTERLGDWVLSARVMFHVQMDLCYARFLLALVTTRPAERRAELKQLLRQYQTLSERYPTSAVAHFRQHLIIEELMVSHRQDKAGDIDELAAQSARELDEALAKAPEDPHLAEVPGHWIFSTMIRRKAVQVLAPAFDGRKDDHGSSASPLDIGALIAALRASFSILYADFIPEGIAIPDAFYALERQRRINNIVYTGALYLGVTGDLSGLSESRSFTREDLHHYTHLLQASELKDRPDIGIVHTIGYAYHVMGDAARAAQAAERLIDMIRDAGVEPNADERMLGVFNDALMWRRGRALPTVEFREAGIARPAPTSAAS